MASLLVKNFVNNYPHFLCGFLFNGGRMKKIEMIKKHDEFTDMIKNAYYLKNHDISIYIRKSKYSYPHFGIAVSKKIGNAVVRNKVKRRMRVILDEYKKDLPFNEDYIIILKENTNNLSFEELRDSFQNLIKKRRNYETRK